MSDLTCGLCEEATTRESSRMIEAAATGQAIRICDSCDDGPVKRMIEEL